jgi:hypothetical protein
LDELHLKDVVMAKVTSKQALVVGAAALATGAAIVATKRRSRHEAVAPMPDLPPPSSDFERRMSSEEPKESPPEITT